MREEDKWYDGVDHNYRPFLVKEKTEDNKTINGYYLTSNINSDYFNDAKRKNIKIVLNTKRYKLKKNSLVLFQKEIKLPYEQVIHYIDHLEKQDLEKLKRSLSVLHEKQDDYKPLKQVPKLGDIVNTNDGCYVIYAVDSVHSYGYLITGNFNINMISKGDFNNIMYNGKIYYIDYEKQKIFKSNDELMTFRLFDEATVKLIKKNKKEIKYRQKKR